MHLAFTREDVYTLDIDDKDTLSSLINAVREHIGEQSGTTPTKAAVKKLIVDGSVMSDYAYVVETWILANMDQAEVYETGELLNIEVEK